MRRSRKTFAFLATPVVLLTLVAGARYDYVRGASFAIQAAGIPGPARTVAVWTTANVVEIDTSLPWRGGVLRGRVYRPDAVNGPATLLVPGVHAAGIEEPRLVEFARNLASSGRVIVTVELPDLQAYSITTRSTDMIEDAALWLSTRSGFSHSGRIGMMGISFAGGLSVVAAARPSLRERVVYVMSLGGHGDLPRTLRYLCTGIQPDGSRRPPHDYGLAIILLGVAGRVVPVGQAQPLRDAILAYLHASQVDMWDKVQAEVEFNRAREMAGRLAEPARTWMTYVNDRDAARLGPVLLPHLASLGGDDALSPARSAPPAAAVYLLHGMDDNVIPAIESKLLAEALVYRGVRAQLLITPLITHANVDRSAGVGHAWQAVRFWSNLLDED
ncbi:MAG: hypothetical protein H0U19_06945 [Acidobacteria bacterium]|nr:hypothetical protein [Acidobacteriota bacterium]